MQWRALPVAFGVAIVATGVAGCSAASSHAGTTSTSAASRAAASTTTVPAVAPIAWNRIANPILASPDHALKDPALVAVNGAWFALFSEVDTRGTWRIGIEHSPDLHTWSALPPLPHDRAVAGEASPDVVRAPGGRYVITFQSYPFDRNGGLSKLYYRTTTDFTHFSAVRPLGLPLHDAPGDRMIDATLAWTPAGLLLGYKTGAVGGTLAFEIARSTTGRLDGPWQLVGRPDIRVFGDTIENDQFIEVDGAWKLIATSNQLDRPFIFDLTGDPKRATGWLRWSDGRQLVVPQESWNPGTGITGATFEHANGAYLVDRRATDGHYYLIYEDAPEMTTYGGEGHGVLAVARSTDLVHWTVPPGGNASPPDTR